MELFSCYHKLNPIAGGGRRDIGCFTFRARRGVHNTIITKLLANVKGCKLAWLFVTDPRNFPHNWRSQVADDKFEPFRYSVSQLDYLDGLIWFDMLRRDFFALSLSNRRKNRRPLTSFRI